MLGDATLSGCQDFYLRQDSGAAARIRSPDSGHKEAATVNKSDLINSVAEATGLTKKIASDCLEATLSAITEALARGEKVTLVGFGTFEVRDRAAKKGVNPVTKAVIDIPASKSPAFKPGKQLKESVAN
jgi:DNA-binding protein HU-beta